MNVKCTVCKREFPQDETPFTCDNCTTDKANDEHTLLTGVLSSARGVLIQWHAGMLESSGEPTQDALSELDDAVQTWRAFKYPDSPCEGCNGTRGGVPGNENIVNGRILCDFCHVDEMGKPEDPVVTVTSEEEAPWAFDDECTRCNTPMTWAGDKPESPEEALCHTCVRAERDAMKDALRAFEGRWGSMCRGTEQYDALLVAARIEPFDVDFPDVDVNPTPVKVTPDEFEIRDGTYWYKGRVVHRAIISAVKDHANYHGVSERYTPIMPNFKVWE